MELKAKKEIEKTGGPAYPDDWPEVGHYQFLVLGIEVQPEKLPNMIIVALEVVTGEVPAQEGKKPDLLLWYDPASEKWSDNAIDRVTRFFWAVGLIKEGEQKNIEPSDAAGKCFIGKVAKLKKPKSKTDRTKIEVTGIEDGGYWPVGHPEVNGLFRADEKVTVIAETKNATPNPDDDDLGDL